MTMTLCISVAIQCPEIKRAVTRGQLNCWTDYQYLSLLLFFRYGDEFEDFGYNVMYMTLYLSIIHHMSL